MIAVAFIAAAGAIIAAALGLLNRQKINEIHVLVNSRLDTAIQQIEDLKTQRDLAQGREDHEQAV